ncbi:hypothetical protein J437_LFUL006927 [Ladona fulva]|uniref:Uncharacterized protein n=1 Tax=Ladona fulva TaxID=123851 RepID=A0A8K0KFG0_LADFU|nr:hypothetical protein J437_LFUL006927 [Ladona fulva]
MRLKEEATLTQPLHIHSGVGLIQTAATDGGNNPTQGLIEPQWISNYDNLTASRVEQQQNTTIHHHNQQQLCLIINNNLDNSKSGCKVLIDSNSNHPEDDNSATHALAVNHQHMQSNINVSMEDTISSMSVSSPEDDDVGDCEDSIKSPHFEDTLVNGGESEGESTTSSSDSDEDLEIESARHTRRGILNPNYPGFQRYAKRLCQEEEKNTEDPITPGNINNNNNNNGVELNQLDGVVNTLDKSFIYTKPKLNIPVAEEPTASEVGIADGQRREKEVNVSSTEVSSDVSMEVSAKPTVNSVMEQEVKIKVDMKMADAYLSGAKEDISVVALLPKKMFAERVKAEEEEEKFMKEELEKEPSEVLSGSPHKREKMEINYNVRMAVQSQTVPAPDVIPQETRSSLKQTKVKQSTVSSSGKAIPGWAKVTRREGSSVRNVPKRRSVPAAKEKWRSDSSGSFDVYNIETAMPKIDLDAIESHLRAAKEEESRVSFLLIH